MSEGLHIVGMKHIFIVYSIIAIAFPVAAAEKEEFKLSVKSYFIGKKVAFVEDGINKLQFSDLVITNFNDPVVFKKIAPRRLSLK